MPKTIDRTNLGELLESGSFSLAELSYAVLEATGRGLNPATVVVLHHNEVAINANAKRRGVAAGHSPEAKCTRVGCCEDNLAWTLRDPPSWHRYRSAGLLRSAGPMLRSPQPKTHIHTFVNDVCGCGEREA